MNRPPIPDDLINISDEEFKKWLTAQYEWETEQIELTLFPNGIPQYTETPEQEKAAWNRFIAKAQKNGVWKEE